MDRYSLCPNETTFPDHDGRGLDEFIYYITTSIDGVLHPLAAVIHTAFAMPLAHSGQQILHSCAGIITLLTDPANRFAIESERSMAVDYYRGGCSESDWDVPDNFLTGNEFAYHEFPIIQTCALLGASLVSLGPKGKGDGYKFGTANLADVHKYLHPQYYGMVIIDITDLDDLRYGIMQFRHDYNRLMTISMSEGTTRAISAAQYRALFLQHQQVSEKDDMDTVKKLGRFKLIGEETIVFSRPQHAGVDPHDSYSPTHPLVDQCIDVLINSTSEIESFDMTIFELPLLTNSFKATLQRLLLQKFEHLPQTCSVGQLLALAYEGNTQLNLVHFRGLSAKVLASALETDLLNDVAELCFRIDDIHGTPDEVIDAISDRPSLRHVCFLLGPLRWRGAWSVELWRAIHRRPQLLKNAKVTFAGAYCKALSRHLWLERLWDGIDHPSCDTFPALNMLVSNVNTVAGITDTTRHSFYLGHGLLSAEAFASRFLRWLPNVSCHDGYPFSVGPQTLGSTSNSEVLPIIAWTEPMALPEGSWVVLVKKIAVLEAYGQLEVIKYAFMKLGSRIDPIEFLQEPGIHSINLEDLSEVFGLKEFLQDTAPDVDQTLVNRLLLDAEKQIFEKSTEVEYAPGPEFKCLSVLGIQEAGAMLNWFLKQGSEKIPNHRLWVGKGEIEYL
ncbi:uncharacterized protein GGS22DRAFT_200347 [Annulohypoxylon maeteangense]|uniref:uncharacterized protein n=1 Tax=Annulohypoxylon maeteangense TaxID=1927788 RepID=UPI002007D670|nr:uncharacterized protein GGS22DRAFT_200347 [Annulohypoxylon maeteangense]KAI0884592.1 hypothetical protein GGS22DRAFT_200347 [Annulohypoxylon maeteangense]